MKKSLLAITATSILCGLGGVAQAEGGAYTQDGFTLHLWSNLPAQEFQQLEKMSDVWQEENSPLKVELTNFDSTASFVNTINNAENLPHLVISQVGVIQSLNHNGHVKPVEEWMPKEDFAFNWSVKHSTYERFLQASKAGESLLGLPWFCDAQALLYDGDAFLEHKVKVVPTTWEQWKNNASNELATQVQVSLSGDPVRLGELVETLVVQQTGQIFDSANPDRFSEATRTALNTLKDLPVDSLSNRSAQEVEMMVGGVDDLLALVEKGKAMKATFVPGVDKQHRWGTVELYDLAVLNNNDLKSYKIRQLAFWLLKGPQQIEFTTATGNIPAHTKAFDNPFFRNVRPALHERLRIFLRAALLGPLKNSDPRHQAMIKKLGVETDRFLKNEITLSQMEAEMLQWKQGGMQDQQVKEDTHKDMILDNPPIPKVDTRALTPEKKDAFKPGSAKKAPRSLNRSNESIPNLKEYDLGK